MSSVAKLYHRLSEEDRRSCWVCFATDEDDMEAGWVQPCMCKGTTKWVHQYCLQRWIDEKQKGNSTAKVACPQCNMEYIILFPKVGPVVYILEKCDKIANMICPFLAGSVIVGSLWWTAVTYGAITVMQVLGSEEGVHVMQVADPLFLLITLPTIPIMMILCKMVRWEDYVLRLWRKHSAKLPFYTNLFPDAFRNSRIPAETAPLFTDKTIAQHFWQRFYDAIGKPGDDLQKIEEGEDEGQIKYIEKSPVTEENSQVNENDQNDQNCEGYDHIIINLKNEKNKKETIENEVNVRPRTCDRSQRLESTESSVSQDSCIGRRISLDEQRPLLC